MDGRRSRLEEPWGPRAGALRRAGPALESATALPAQARLLGSLQRSAGNRSVSALVQRLRENTTGLPGALKSGIESLSGVSLDHLNVHYDSPEPARLGALAYTRGGDIHVAAGEERQLPHEAWHAVQQAEGRVRATQTESGVAVNEDAELEREADVMGERALSAGPQSPPLSRAARRAPTLAAEAVAQLQRQNIPSGGGAMLTLAAIEAIIVLIDQQLAELQPGHPEITEGFIDMARVTNWRQDLTTRLTTLRGLNPGGGGYTQDQIKARDTPLMNAFYDAVVTAGNLRRALNTSLSEYAEHKARQDEIVSATGAREAYAQEKEKERARTATAVGEYVSPYTGRVDKYDDALEGAPIIVEGHFVVVVEHYQLKHNANLGILQAGGPFKGKKGSSMPGGWEEHRNTYAVQVLQMAKAAIAKLNGQFDASTKINLEKQRTADIEAYLTITREGEDWIIAYHCNPPK